MAGNVETPLLIKPQNSITITERSRAHADQAIKIDEDTINEDDKEKSLMLVAADVAYSDDFTLKLENFLEKYSDVNCTSKSGKTLVHYIARCENGGGNEENCVKILTEKGANLNLQDDDGMTALHYAAINNNQPCANALIKAGADLCVKNKVGKSATNYMIRHLPNSITAIEERLDNGIIVKWETSKADGNTSYNKNVTMDFNVLMPTVEKKSSDVTFFKEILDVFESDNHIDYTEAEQLEKILLHPLTQCFLNFKWYQVRLLYFLVVSWHIIFAVTYSFYIYILYSKLCDPLKLGIKWKNAEWNENGTRIEGRWVWPQHIKSRFHGKIECGTDDQELISYLTAFWIATIVFVVIKALIEVKRLSYFKKSYFRQWETLLSLLIIFTFPLISLHEFSFLSGSSDPKQKYHVNIKAYQYHIAAIGILFTWLLNMLYISQNPVLGNYVQMLVKVSINFMKFFIACVSLLIAFAGAFSILFPRESSMQNMATSPLKE